MNKVVARVLIGLLVASAANLACGEEWGDVSGTFQFKGEIPEASRIVVTKDAEVCGKHNLVDPSLVVNADNKGVANVVVYMYLGKRDDPPAIHESYSETAKSEVALDNINCEFQPHIALVRTSQTLLIGNKDSVGHNTKIACSKNREFNPIVPANGSVKAELTEVERQPVAVSCSIHPWMKGWVVAKDNPYFAVTDKDGKFVIKNVPAGEWTFQVWHEKVGYVDQVTKEGSTEKWKKGRVEVKVTADGVDLGTCEIDAASFDE